MRSICRMMGCVIGIPLLIAMAVSCATIPDLKVTYRLPPSSDELRGKKLSLAFVDMRGKEDILGEGAKKDFGLFSGNISLYFARGDEQGILAGLFDLRTLFMETFKKRLEDLGIEVVSGAKDQIGLVIVLNAFSLNLVDRKWITRMSYEARIEKDGKVITRQTINGEAERLKLVGRAQADIVMSDIFTDIINKLDVVRLIYLGSRQDQ